jgi:hypothetical protein
MLISFAQWYLFSIKLWNHDEDGNDPDAKSWWLREFREYSIEISSLFTNLFQMYAFEKEEDLEALVG